MSLLWIDLETTGLDPVKDAVLEIAAIVTDDDLEEQATFHAYVWPTRRFGRLEPVVQAMHRASGLAALLWRTDGTPDGEAASAYTAEEADAALQRFIVEACELDPIGSWSGMQHARAAMPQAAGSTVGFDREFMRHHLPHSLRLLHHRSLDITSLNELARRCWPSVHEARPRGRGKHRAMDDIRDSLAVARYYASALGPVAA